MDHFGFSLIQALIYILNETWARFSAWSLPVCPCTLQSVFISRNTCWFDLFMSSECWAYIMVCDLPSDEAGL